MKRIKQISQVNITILCAFLVILCFFTFGCDRRQQISQSTQAPDFTLQDMFGKEVKLSELIGQKPLVLDFWASWCPYCRAEIPEVVELHNNYKDKINVVGISLDQSYADAQKYTQKNFIPYPNLYDARGMVARTYQIAGIPALIIINSKGEIIKRNASMDDIKALTR